MKASLRILIVAFPIFISFCRGTITSPPYGQKFVFLPESSHNITWTLNVTGRINTWVWSFTPCGSSSSQQLARLFPISDTPDYSPSPLTFEVFKPGILWLKNTNQSYNGEFTFTVLTSTGTTSRINVYIAVKPNVVHNCSNLLVVNEGDNVSCVCRGEGGNPPANVTWFDKNNNILGDDVGVVSKTSVITNVTMNDGGNYRCKAQSYNDPRFRDEKSIEILVKAAYPPQQTNITISPMSVKKDHKVTIFCLSDGYPEPTYQIYHNGTGNMRVVSNDRTYIIQSVNFNNAGSYRCEAKNKHGSDLSDVKYLTVSREFIKVRKDGDGVSNIGLIIGIVVGMLFLLAILVVIFCCYKSKQKNGYQFKDDFKITTEKRIKKSLYLDMDCFIHRSSKTCGTYQNSPRYKIRNDKNLQQKQNACISTSVFGST
ncbi:carcinoembryonic antigen-related cell adhesion molecule 6-like isoform X2 [Xenia sp. Carnegie-2017]|uniref:carcinoembryonic antigen-related cell adhesion molecule 6-like isoform X2 n=1 Tax=Xenia sp. Carnegie-2017 TaxID=2897299 RepID=UPI001F03D1CA|nr:carcinoembryonic antigen-related cell adhesion molecule 6-like isoform X2 [Xenia sp. Carnegie-2017]